MKKDIIVTLIRISVCIAFFTFMVWEVVGMQLERHPSENTKEVRIVEREACDLSTEEQWLCGLSRKEMAEIVSGSAKFSLAQYWGYNSSLMTKEDFVKEISRVQCTHFEDYKRYLCGYDGNHWAALCSGKDYREPNCEEL